MDHNSATVPVDCETCGSQATGEVYETIIGRRLHWVLELLAARLRDAGAAVVVVRPA